ncbi:hypothetical protein D5282_00300 [bacterium 1xD8-48]|jgi:hypothetical protein|nr:hypothetical protein [Lachnospiraceae bacterium]NBJ95801.1 hypothetical protein [bacterium 1xD8-48]
MVIPPLKKTFSDEKKHQSRQKHSSSPAKGIFSEILDKSCKKEQQNNIHIRTNGYTRNALPYVTFINLREYS